jgi:Flp pilus assembly protein TadG
VAAVEFALVVPLLLVVLFGIIDFGFMLYDKAMLTNAAREGARAGIVLRETRLTLDEVQNRAHEYCQNRMIRLGGGDGADCTATASRTGTTSLDDTLTVSVNYTYDGPIVTLIGLIGGSLELGTMSSTAVMKYE